MKTVLYIDVLILEGTIINYILLLSTATFLNLQKSKWRMAVAAIFGGFASLLILLPSPHPIFEIFVKILLTIIIVLIAYKGTKIALVKASVWYLLFNCLLAGLLILLYAFGMTDFYSRNMQLYFDISPIILVLVTVALYIIIKIICVFVIKPDESVKIAKISCRDIEFEILAVYDSGFVAHDVFSGAPLVLVSFPEIANKLNDKTKFNIEDYYKTGIPKEGYTLVPLDGVGGSELALSLYPVKMSLDDKVIENVKICFSRHSLNVKGAHCLLSKEFMEVLTHASSDKTQSFIKTSHM